jgi:hypothetical protein
MLEQFMIPSNLTTADPAYRLLRLTLLSTDQQTCVNCMSKLLTTISTSLGQAALIQLLKGEVFHLGDVVFV